MDLGDVLDGVVAKMKDLDGEAFAGLRQRLADLRRRLAEQRLHVAILGQFKRGKSTVLNALLGESLLPTAVVPVTAIPTYVQAGATPRVASRFAASGGRSRNSRPRVPPTSRSTSNAS